MSVSPVLAEAVRAMTDPDHRCLFDVTLICTSDDNQAEYWMKRLSEGVCRKVSGDESSIYPLVLAVSEDWSKGGAGNGLGTLYAFKKACAKAKKDHGIDLDKQLTEEKISIGLFHTAGKGTRLAPLPASENNNKPGVKLPVCQEMRVGGQSVFSPITVLEAVVKQTGVYAPSRKGRMSVFWGDQIFIPSAPFKYTPTHHADIMCTLLGESAPTAEEWAEKGLEKYGVIAVSKDEGKNAAQVEKVDHATATKMLKVLGDIGQVGPSLGSFSVSAALLNALCNEYSAELSAKKGKFDTDPHFWMPLTLPEEDYVSLMSQKGVAADESKAHHERMSKMKLGFSLNGMGLFGAVDVGDKACWWDYGLLKLYSANNLKFMDDDESAILLRKFFNVTSNQMNSTVSPDVKVDQKSCVFSSTVTSGSISNSMLAGVEALDIQLDGAIVINCTAKKIVAGKNCILYNIVDDSEEGIIVKDGDIVVSVTDESGKSTELRSRIDLCGGKSWKTVVEGNKMTFEQMFAENTDADVIKIEAVRKKLCRQVSSGFGIK